MHICGVLLLVSGIFATGSSKENGPGGRRRLPHMGKVFMGSYATCGNRAAMEDEHVLLSSESLAVAAVFDGHGGQEVARQLKDGLVRRILEQRRQSAGGGRLESDDSLAWAVGAALRGIDAEVSSEPRLARQGSTAAVLVVNTGVPSALPAFLETNASLVAVNVGDSRIVLSRAGRAVDLSRDHKPGLAAERARIEAVGGSVVWTGLTDPATGRAVPGAGVYRVNGVLALSRAIGDANEKPAVCSDPEHIISKCSALDEFVIVASDGLWDVFSSQEAVDFIRQIKRELWDRSGATAYNSSAEMFINRAARSLVESALDRGSSDNITVLLVVLGDRFLLRGQELVRTPQKVVELPPRGDGGS